MLKPVIACVAVGGIGGLTLASCSADKTDFQKKATEVIVDELHKTDKEATATCDKPDGTDVGTTFSCTATLQDGTQIPLVAKITKKNFVEVTSAPGDDPAVIAELLVGIGAEAGFEVDRDCAAGHAARLSAEDRAAIAADPGGEPELSAEGEQITADAVECFSVTDDTRAAFAESLSSNLGITADETKDCIAEAIDSLSDDELLEIVAATGEGGLPGDLQSKLNACA